MKLYYPDSRVSSVRQKNFFLFALSNYGINCQKKWYQPAVSVLLNRAQIQCMCHFKCFISVQCVSSFSISFRAVVSAFEPFCPVDTVLLFTVLLCCICVDN